VQQQLQLLGAYGIGDGGGEVGWHQGRRVACRQSCHTLSLSNPLEPVETPFMDTASVLALDQHTCGIELTRANFTDCADCAVCAVVQERCCQAAAGRVVGTSAS
jgi:hypothetical protein